MKKVKFHFNTKPFKLAHRNLLRNFIGIIFKKEGRDFSNLEIIFCDDQELLQLNRQFLHHDYFTDILTFNLGSNKTIEGEIYISIPQVKANAIKFNVPFSEELHRIIIHGVLHLSGYTDKTKAARIRMEANQEVYLQQYFQMVINVPRGTS